MRCAHCTCPNSRLQCSPHKLCILNLQKKMQDADLQTQSCACGAARCSLPNQPGAGDLQASPKLQPSAVWQEGTWACQLSPWPQVGGVSFRQLPPGANALCKTPFNSYFVYSQIECGCSVQATCAAAGAFLLSGIFELYCCGQQLFWHVPRDCRQVLRLQAQHEAGWKLAQLCIPALLILSTRAVRESESLLPHHMFCHWKKHRQCFRLHCQPGMACVRNDPCPSRCDLSCLLPRCYSINSA